VSADHKETPAVTSLIASMRRLAWKIRSACE
jgi:hypothetical protein